MAESVTSQETKQEGVGRTRDDWIQLIRGTGLNGYTTKRYLRGWYTFTYRITPPIGKSGYDTLYLRDHSGPFYDMGLLCGMVGIGYAFGTHRVMRAIEAPPRIVYREVGRCWGLVLLGVVPLYLHMRYNVVREA